MAVTLKKNISAYYNTGIYNYNTGYIRNLLKKWCKTLHDIRVVANFFWFCFSFSGPESTFQSLCQGFTNVFVSQTIRCKMFTCTP